MKKTKISPLGTGGNDKVLIGDELTGSERVEYICSQCHCGPLVTIADKTGNSDLFCRRCGVTYEREDNTVRHKSRLRVPQENEPAVSIVQHDYNKDVEIRHTPELKGGFAQLSKKGTIRFTSYEERVG